jgi:hypothetical protein
LCFFKKKSRFLPHFRNWMFFRQKNLCVAKISQDRGFGF